MLHHYSFTLNLDLNLKFGGSDATLNLTLNIVLSSWLGVVVKVTLSLIDYILIKFNVRVVNNMAGGLTLVLCA